MKTTTTATKSSGATEQTISNLLRTVKSGEYSFSGQANMLAAMCGLYAEDIGAIGLPLQPEQTLKLIA
uniref:Uncharacterized protein n=1 Tax=Globisporangium ultimum (strain ATCC 200006 / CBS 805.95 / DAOM BR144) TaxID=431595 RepID=K3WA41_GLOUD